MEMHQVRYFLAVARVLNFTRAAEECHVAQPSLTRAVKQLEDELGGQLFRRERSLTHLTDLGQRMLPMMQQCYDSAMTAKSLAHSIRSGAVAPLSIALSHAVEISLLIKFLTELVRALPGLELRCSRGSGPELAEHLKKGVADVAVGGPLGETWDRLDNWTLFTEPYRLVIGSAHALASRSSVSAAELNKEHLLQQTFCEHNAELCAFLAESGAPSYPPHQVGSERDALALLASNIGACIMPESSVVSEEVRRVDIDGFSLMRPVCVYAVSGRQRSVAANTFIKMLRAADWTEHSHRPQRHSA